MITPETDIHACLLEHIEAIRAGYTLAVTQEAKKGLVLGAVHKALAGTDPMMRQNVLNLMHSALNGNQVNLDQIIAWLRSIVDNPVDNQALLRESVDDFDRQFNTSTSKVIYHYEMEEEITADRYRHATRYVPSPVKSVNKLMNYLQYEINMEDFVFIDVGSGLARNVLLASHYPFKKIIGIEISAQLHGTAQANVRNYRSPKVRCTHVDLQCVNALDFSFPDSNMVLYLYEPFSDEIAGRFFHSLENFLAGKQLAVYLVFLPIVYPVIGKSKVFRPKGEVNTPETLGSNTTYFTYYLFSNIP